MPILARLLCPVTPVRRRRNVTCLRETVPGWPRYPAGQLVKRARPSCSCTCCPEDSGRSRKVGNPDDFAPGPGEAFGNIGGLVVVQLSVELRKKSMVQGYGSFSGAFANV